jgi:hypothetical protein
MNKRTGSWTAMLIGLLGVSCGGGGSSKPVTVADFCAQKAQQECQVAGICGAATLTVSDCESQRAAVCMTAAGAVQSPRVFVPGNIAKCVNTAKTVYAKTTGITPTDLNSVTDACNYVFQGNVDKLGACTVKYDCTGARICDKGKCADMTTKAAGAQCLDFGAVCATGSYCANDPTTMVLTCLPKAARGATCDAATPCQEALRCFGGKCTDPKASGETCSTSDDCVSTGTPYCDPFAGGTCDMGLFFAPQSASCHGFTASGVTAGTGTGTPVTTGNDGGAVDGNTSDMPGGG